MSLYTRYGAESAALTNLTHNHLDSPTDLLSGKGSHMSCTSLPSDLEIYGIELRMKPENPLDMNIRRLVDAVILLSETGGDLRKLRVVRAQSFDNDKGQCYFAYADGKT